MSEYLVWCPEEGETEYEARVYDANFARFAAQAWAEQKDVDSGDHLIVNGKMSPLVYVRCPDGELATYRVHGETVARYTAEGEY